MGPFERMMHRLADRQTEMGAINGKQWCEVRELSFDDLEKPLSALAAAVRLGVMELDTVLAMSVELGFEVARERYGPDVNG
jgi:hypothetical protein